VTDTTARTFYRYLIYSALANLMSQHGNPAEAVRYAKLGLDEAQNNHNPFFIAEAELTLAQLKQQIRAADEELKSVEAIRAEAQRMDWQGTEQRAEYLLSGLHLAKGQADKATTAATRAVELARQLQMRDAEITSLLRLAQTLASNSRKSEAQETLKEVKRLSQQSGYEKHLNKAEEQLASLSA
jgi:tetratricopeptide (TPR) repeat protein